MRRSQVNGHGNTTKAPGQPGHFAVRVTIPDSPDADKRARLQPGDITITAVLFSTATDAQLDTSHACLHLKLCRPSEPITQKLTFEQETDLLKKVLDRVDEITKALTTFAKRWPGFKVTPNPIALSGELSLKTGKECCPDAAIRN